MSDPQAQTAYARPPIAELARRLSGRPLKEVAAAGADQAARWHAGERAPAEDYLAAFPALAGSPEEALVLIAGEVLPTLLMDEAQSISRRGSEPSEVIREILNAGIGRNARPPDLSPSLPIAAPGGKAAGARGAIPPLFVVACAFTGRG